MQMLYSIHLQMCLGSLLDVIRRLTLTLQVSCKSNDVFGMTVSVKRSYCLDLIVSTVQ